MLIARFRPLIVGAVWAGIVAATSALAQGTRPAASQKPKPKPAESQPVAAQPSIEHVEEQKTAYLLSGIARRQQLRYREAIDDLTIYVTGNDRDPDGHWELGFSWALYNEARPMAESRRKALEHFRKCYELSPAYQRSLPQSAKPGVVALVAEARKAAGVVGDAPAPRPIEAEGLLRLAESQADSGDLLEAKKNFDEVQNVPPPPAVADRERVRSKIDRLFGQRILKLQSLEASNLAAAQSEAAELLRFFPDEPVALETYVRLQLKYSRAAMESVAGQKIYQSYRNNIEGFMLKGLYRDAISEVNRLLFNFPRSEFGEKKYNEILEKNDQALKSAEESLKGGRLEEARRKYEVIRDNYPFLGVAQDAISEIDEVRRKLEASLDRETEKGNFGLVYETAKELASKFPANQKAKDSVAATLQEVARRLESGKTASREGRLFDAIVWFEKALAVVPGQTEAQEGRDRARTQIRDQKKKLWAFMEMIPGGRFTLGGGPTPESKPKNKNAATEPYVLDRYKVSNAQYQFFVQATGAKVPETWKDALPEPQKADYAVSGIGYAEAEAYCRWIGKRLPDEFEWEKAARGTDGLDFPYDDAPGKERKQYNPFQEYAVNRWPGLASPFKIEGMHTNHWEWTSSWFAPYPGNDEASVRNVARETFKVVRGGARSPSFPGIEKALEVSARDKRAPVRRDADLSFRCASNTAEVPSWLNDEPQPEKVREPGTDAQPVKP